MTLGENLKKLRLKRGWTQSQLGEKINVGKASVSGYENGNRTPDNDTLVKLANIFGVSVDYLLDNEQKGHYYDLTEKEKADIGVQADNLLEGIESGTDINFYGEPATAEQKERLRVAIRTAMEMNKEEAKKKFTPKKYRD